MRKEKLIQVLERDILADYTWCLCSVLPRDIFRLYLRGAGNLPLVALYFLKEVKRQSPLLSDTRLSQVYQWNLSQCQPIDSLWTFTKS